MVPLLLAVGLFAVIAGGQLPPASSGGFGGFGVQNYRLGGCPEAPLWTDLLQEIGRGAELFKSGNYASAKALLAEAAEAVTRDESQAFSCSLGIASLYRALAFAHCADTRQDPQLTRRANQIGLRFLHLAMNWLTHTFVTSGHDQPLIDGSAWPISIQEINDDLTSVASAIARSGPTGHAPTLAGRELRHDYSRRDLKIAIVSLCAYPADHPLPGFSMSNQGMYAKRHGYTYIVERELVDTRRPPAWGKVKLVEREVLSGRWDWVVWSDCDTYFMNMSTTVESVLYTYAGRKAAGGDLELDPEVHMIVTEDSAMLNTGIFFARCTDWVGGLLRRVWGSDTSPWINHPWWENAAFGWEFLKDMPRNFATEDPAEWALRGEDDLTGVYARQVRVAPQSHFNSYHPITSRFQHDTWQEGKYVIAFNGVLSGSSPAVVQTLYANYYRLACELNNVQSQCVSSDW
ncbi:unnamed protein product [Polarella glacialis]|uniref:Uncharacterized protein n=1 Tax=Polarella glacialis TaxID=89957 RepID=A0A813EE29_POLGL|nr:unnamed protein product [Polarella glacialis]